MNNKNKKIIIISVIALFLVLGIGLTYAYFKSQIDNGDKKNVDVTSDTTDQLLFDVDNNINLSINQFNFGPGAGDLVSESKATASLKANSVENIATYNYYVYFNIQENEFVYTTPDEKTEILLQITDPTGNKVTSIEGLKYDNSLEGFDITTASGLFKVAESYEITSSSSTDATIQEWNFTAKFINLDSDQEANTGKSMNGIIVMQRLSDTSTLASKCSVGTNLAGCIKDYATSGIKDVVTGNNSTNIYHHDGTLENGINDNSYRYGGEEDLIVHDNYKTNYKQTFNMNIKTNDGVIAQTCDNEMIPYGNGCGNKKKQFITTYNINNKYDNVDDAINKAIEDGYLTFTKVNNYICLDDQNDGPCSIDNKYRIVGVFDGKVKLIKYKSIGKMPWDENGTTNDWTQSTLQKYLNTTFYDTLGFYKEKISTHKWIIGGLCYDSWDWSSKMTYDLELGKDRLLKGSSCDSYDGTDTTVLNDTFDGKIGLIYLSDLSYAASKDMLETWNPSWLLTPTIYDNKYTSQPLYESWTITRAANYNTCTFRQDIGEDDVSVEYNVNPVFYLNSDVTYKSGYGSYENPIRIEV